MDDSIVYGSNKFEEYWKKTEIIRTFDGILPPFDGVKLPYVVITLHESKKASMIVSGSIILGESQLELPPSYGSKKNISPHELHFDMYRNFYIDENMQKGFDGPDLDKVVEKYLKQIESINGAEIGLIKIPCDNAFVAGLRRYSDGIIQNSYETNAKELIKELVETGILSIDWLLKI